MSYNNLTHDELIAIGKSAAVTFEDKLGYTTTSFDSVSIAENVEPVFWFGLMDDFQKNLEQTQRVDCSYYQSVPYSKLLKLSPLTWRNREQRELAVMAKQLGSVAGLSDKIESDMAKAFLAVIQEQAQELSNLLEHHKDAD